MKFKYGKYIPSLADEVDMEELVSALSEMLLSSGFQSPFGDGSLDGDRTMQALHDAILDALLNGGLLPDDLLEQLFGEDAATAKQQLDELVQQLMERMQEAGYITPSPELEQRARASGAAGRRRRRRRARRGEVRGHRQGARLPRLPRAARSARLARPLERGPARHARHGHRHRGQRRAQALRVRRHAQPRRQQHRAERGDPRASRRPAAPSTRAPSTSPTRT